MARELQRTALRFESSVYQHISFSVTTNLIPSIEVAIETLHLLRTMLLGTFAD